MFIQLLPLGIVVIANVFLALFVFFRNRDSWVNRSFALFAGTLSLWTFCISMLSSQRTLLWSDATLLFGNVIGVGSFALFAKHFPANHEVSRKSLFFFILLPVALFCVLTPFHPFVSGINVNNDQITPVLGPLYPILMLWSIFGVIYGIYSIYKKYRKGNGIEKIQLTYLFWGFFIFLFTVTLTGVILPAMGIASLGFFSPFASLIMIAIISYAIVRHRLMDINFLVARTVAFVLLILLFGTIHSVVFIVLSNLYFNENLDTRTLVLLTILTILTAVTFQPVIKILQKVTNRIFYRDNYDTDKALYELTVIMASTLQLGDLTNYLLQYLLVKMKVSKGAFFLFDSNKNTTIIQHGFDRDFSLEIDDLKKFSEKSVIKLYEDLDEGNLKSLMRNNDFRITISLKSKKEFIGLLVFGEKFSGDAYSSQDIRLLSIFSSAAAVAIQNAQSVEEIRAFNVTLEAEVNRATSNLKVANRRLKELDKLKDEFVSVASHELRTPMTSIKSYLWMAIAGKGGKVPEKVKFYLDRAYTSTDRLIKLVNDMLNISRIESGRISLDFEKVDMPKLIQDVVDEVLPRSQELSLKVIFEKPTESNIEAVADADKIKEVLINFIGNSMKFTPKGGTITVRVKKDKDSVLTEVQDTGVGMDEDTKKSLFQKFGLIPGSYRTNQNVALGTGLGLYISKSIIDLHDGKIEGNSEGKDKGSTFSFTLPVFSEATLRSMKAAHPNKTDLGIIHTKLN